MNVVNSGLLNKLMRCCLSSELFLLSWIHSGADNSGCGSLENENRILECAPLSLWDPKDSSELLLAQEIAKGELGVAETENSKWVSQLLKSFCKCVGFPTVKHKAQCVALFRLLEQGCLAVRKEVVPKHPANSRKKCLRELMGLASIVNYDGLSSSKRNKGSLTG